MFVALDGKKQVLISVSLGFICRRAVEEFPKDKSEKHIKQRL